MSSRLELRLNRALQSRIRKGLLRELRSQSADAIDFSSNDYLGLSRPGSFQEFVQCAQLQPTVRLSSGSTGSRLLTGHSTLTSQLETTAAQFHQSESSLLFNSGYDANLSILSCVPSHSDCIVYDELIHASIHDGMRMGRASQNLMPFKHNNLVSFKQTILRATEKHLGDVLVCVETVYSMDGDVAPLREMLEIASIVSRKLGRDVHIIADEAHAGGLFGKNGEGLACELGAQQHPNLLARVVTYGKAFAAHGAVVLGSKLLVQYLINYARPFIYSTALPPHSVTILHAVYAFAVTEEAKHARQKLWSLVDCFKRVTGEKISDEALLASNGQSPIQGILVPGNRECVAMSKVLRKKGFDVYPIRSPTVPQGSERIRIIVHAHNTEDEIKALIDAIAQEYTTRASRL